MPEIQVINPRISKLLVKFSLQNKFNKQIRLLSQNPNHPSLRIELLKPKKYGIYSFRIDRKFRALFIFRKDKNTIEILNITLHYQK